MRIFYAMRQSIFNLLCNEVKNPFQNHCFPRYGSSRSRGSSNARRPRKQETKAAEEPQVWKHYRIFFLVVAVLESQFK